MVFLLLAIVLLLACSALAETNVLPDGTYSAVFKTDSGMFRVSEALGNRGVLTVKDGQMMIHVSLNSKKILNLFP